MSLLCSGNVFASPLDAGSWYQVARMSDSDTGMFDGNGDLKSDYTYGTFTSTLQADDFARPFDAYAGMEILFITGDLLYWAKTSYADLRSLIDAHGNSFAPNIQFDAAINGVEQTTTGNVLSRALNVEDPWISISGDHGAAVAASLIIWGEDNWGELFFPSHVNLKNAHQGVNVYVSQLPSEVPLPAALPLFAAGLGAMGYLGRRRKRARALAAG
jgi:hypothetical protein